MRRRTSNPPTFSWTRSAGAIAHGHACASTCSTCPRSCGRNRTRSIPTRTWPRNGAGRSASRTPRAEDLLELVRGRDFELIVAAVRGLLVGTPPLEYRRVAKPVPLHVVVFHLTHAFDPH